MCHLARLYQPLISRSLSLWRARRSTQFKNDQSSREVPICLGMEPCDQKSPVPPRNYAPSSLFERVVLLCPPHVLLQRIVPLNHSLLSAVNEGRLWSCYLGKQHEQAQEYLHEVLSISGSRWLFSLVRTDLAIGANSRGAAPVAGRRGSTIISRPCHTILRRSSRPHPQLLP